MREGGKKEITPSLHTHITLPGGPAQLRPTALMVEGDVSPWALSWPLAQGVPCSLILSIL